nr:immunoglobulin light chain junction region [Macaca mulatta]MOW54654.1 immunoglobulin light chain junction region [Macaca mulatta]MOY00386.1 immunoglobulin light chain junction region [Macaca mulatta]MOY10450.1 immunoglobulin light chain junction region [Macaca mulatta]
CMRALEFPWTF